MPYRPPAWAQDLLLALFVTVMQVQGTISRTHDDPVSVLRPLSDLGNLGYGLLITGGAVVVLRRRRPVAVFAVTALTSVTYYALDFPDGPGWLGLFVALYTVTARGDGRRSLFLAAAAITVLAVTWLVAAADIEPPAAIGWVFFRIGASVMSAALGESVRTRKVIAAEAVQRAELAERTREREARARVDEERLRIAREVHDTVAHAIAVINVQAGMTAHVLARGEVSGAAADGSAAGAGGGGVPDGGPPPGRAREALEIIEQTSSRALREMRTILGVLHGAGDGRAPHPGLGEIGELTTAARAAGLDVELAAPSPPPAVPTAVGSAVYRILQESITNVIRHAGPTRVTVAVDYDADAVRIRVTDEGPQEERATGPDPGEPGRGISGMRERCRLLGGDLDARPVGGGFAVTARLPLAPAEAVDA
ncbi:histidine kinase [Couchioplanes caeruleus]|uniref:sensor histidine kinase n=1 Tax=Couchioplanes caeruleus TaxID=56438 RepID=UPI00201BC998|nr:histidine kinase [Couchioplanes caeruleus]UQU66955.1 histidine kinase [Couchioplanes caeruleus]